MEQMERLLDFVLVVWVLLVEVGVVRWVAQFGMVCVVIIVMILVAWKISEAFSHATARSILWHVYEVLFFTSPVNGVASVKRRRPRRSSTWIARETFRNGLMFVAHSYASSTSTPAPETTLPTGLSFSSRMRKPVKRKTSPPSRSSRSASGDSDKAKAVSR